VVAASIVHRRRRFLDNQQVSYLNPSACPAAVTGRWRTDNDKGRLSAHRFGAHW